MRLIAGLVLMAVVSFAQLAFYATAAWMAVADDRLLEALAWGVIGPLVALLTSSWLARPIAALVTIGARREAL